MLKNRTAVQQSCFDWKMSIGTVRMKVKTPLIFNTVTYKIEFVAKY